MKRRWVYFNGEAHEVGDEPAPSGLMVIPDLPGYQSPVTGLWVEGRVQRREDLKRTGSRPWEGMATEKQEAARAQGYLKQKNEQSLERAAGMAWNDLPTRHRRALQN